MDTIQSGADLLLIGQVASTWAMMGVIMIVQIVHYPLFSSVGASSFPVYQALHTRRITWVVGPLMLIELGTAIALLALRRTDEGAALLWIGLGLLVIIWISTAAIQVPLHTSLSKGFDASTHRKLVATNWVRTGAWLLRGLVVGGLLHQELAAT